MMETKKMERKRLLFFGILVIGILISAYLFLIPHSKDVDNKIVVVVTIPPQAEFVEKIGGNRVKVVIMIPPDANPHTYEPTPFQLREVSKAKLYAKVGSGIEFELSWMDKILSVNKKMLVVDCSKGIEIIDNDPHIWLSPKNAKIMVENIFQGLVEVDPSNKEYYARNKEKYLEELDELDKDIARILSKKKNKKIIVYHPAWTYFARDYGLEQIAIEKEGKEPTPQGIASLIKQAKENNITLIFASPQSNPKIAQVIAEEINGKVIMVDPLKKDYLQNMRKVAEAFASD